MNIQYGVIVLVLINFLHADLESLVENPSFDKITAKYHARKNNKCNIFIEILNNNDWEKKKNRLNVQMKRMSGCRVVTIYKIIQNIKVKERNLKKDEFDINIGTIIKNPPFGLKIKTITIIKNSDITSSNCESKVNMGTYVKTKTGYINNISIDSKTKIKHSEIGRYH